MGGFTYEGAVVLPERSTAACALASADDRLWLAWTGGDQRLNLLSSADGEVFEGKVTLRHTSSRTDTSMIGTMASSRAVALPPALAGTRAHGLHLAWTGTDGQLNLWPVGRYPEGHMVLPERSNTGPALGVRSDRIVLAWKGTDRRLNVSAVSEEGFGKPWTLMETSDQPPAVTATGDALVLAWSGTDRRLNVIRWLGTGTPEPWRPGPTSPCAPALCPWGDDLVLVWTGGDRVVNVALLRSGAIVDHLEVPDATSPHAPALAAHGGQLFLAWTGTDDRPNIGRIRV